jgi:hypothetical protein
MMLIGLIRLISFIRRSSMARVQVLKSVSEGRLCFQWCRYIYDNGERPETGYRFIWRREDGTLQAARGQARLPSIKHAEQLIAKAKAEGGGI